jgi:hypothetical protein
VGGAPYELGLQFGNRSARTMSAKSGDEGVETTGDARLGKRKGEAERGGQMLEIALIDLGEMILAGTDHGP